MLGATVAGGELLKGPWLYAGHGGGGGGGRRGVCEHELHPCAYAWRHHGLTCTMPAGVCTRIVCPATAPGGTTTFTSVGMAGATVAVAVCAATGAIDSRNASTSYSILVTAKFDMGIGLTQRHLKDGVFGVP